ncbi:MAG: 1,4-alpha-glucan branching protein GlgB [Magnetospiraceae bacterium]
MKPQDNAANIAAIVEARHHDPFGFLGAHEEPGGVVFRCFEPDAEAVTVLRADTREMAVALVRRHDAGFFEGHIEGGKKFSYLLRVTRGGWTQDIDDPYRFPPRLGELDLHLLTEGTHLKSYEKLGAHRTQLEGVEGVNFAVWAPNAERVSVVGDFNNWDGRRHTMRVHPSCGVWEIFLPGVQEGAFYKFEIRSRSGVILPLKSDPYAFRCELPPGTAGIVEDDLHYDWTDDDWMASRQGRHGTDAPMSVYEVHLGSWRRKPEDGNRWLTYREMAEDLVPYVRDMGFSHIELLPVSEFPFDGSWGYQPIGLFAPTSRFGTPDDFRFFVDRCHNEGIGVILDWVPGHFPSDEHGLGWFDGTALYEHADPRQGKHQDWGTLIYNFGRQEVANYLHSNALFWLEHFHIDGLRVDAVASMLYLDYSREEGQWVPNKYGGRENLEAVAFLKRLNELVYSQYPGAFTVAEESTAWPMVSRPVYLGGLGFGFKWNMGWMNDTLRYMSNDPVYRSYHQNQLTFGLLYAFTENFILPLSHDEVVHGKGSLIGRMPGDDWQRFANLRAYFTFMFTHPGKKLLFMGGEIAQFAEWNHDQSLDWHLLNYPNHAGMQALVRDLNFLYRDFACLHSSDSDGEGFSWIDCNDTANSVMSYVRKAPDDDYAADLVIVCNFTPVARESYRIGMPHSGRFVEVFNSDDPRYGGSGVTQPDGVWAEAAEMHGFPASASLRLPPLGVTVLRPD